jgi:hypothetical protein
VTDNPVDDGVLGKGNDDLHLTTALGADYRIDLIKNRADRRHLDFLRDGP